MSHLQLEAELANYLKNLEIASWERPRSNDELISFITRRHQVLAEVDLA